MECCDKKCKDNYIEEYIKCLLENEYSIIRVAFVEDGSWVKFLENEVFGAAVDLLTYIISNITHPTIKKVKYFRVNTIEDALTLLDVGSVDLVLYTDPILPYDTIKQYALLAIDNNIQKDEPVHFPRGILFNKYASKLGVWLQMLFDKSVACNVYQNILKSHNILYINVPCEMFSIELGLIPHVSIYELFLPRFNDKHLGICRTKVRNIVDNSAIDDVVNYYIEGSVTQCDDK